MSREALAAITHAAENAEPYTTEECPAFRVTDHGVEYRHETRDGDVEYRVLCPRLEILGRTRNADSEDWGRLVSFHDADGQLHRLAIAAADLVRDGGADALAHLARLGFRVPTRPKEKGLLTDYLFDFPVTRRVRAASSVGWQADGCFVLPDRTFGSRSDEDTHWQQEGRTVHPFAESGTLKAWKSKVAAPCIGNSRLIFSLSAAFAGPLLHPLSEESGGVHLRGPSSCGKTTGLIVASSVWGKTVRSWRSTDNGQEWVAALHNDAFLAIDEIGQADGRAAEQLAYMLANGLGKARANAKGGVRKTATWRIIFVSTGEVSLADKVGEQGRGRTTKAGQEVRVLDVPADAGAGMGVFQALHHYDDPAALADALKAAAKNDYGTAGPAFLEALVAKNVDELREEWRAHKASFLSKISRPQSDGQVKRGAARFALVAFAGELAVRFGILPWSPGDALRASVTCFEAWLETRGGVGSTEARQVLERVQRAILTQRGRFQDWNGSEDAPRDRLGFYRAGDDGGFFFHAPAFRDILAGLDERQALAALDQAGFLEVYQEGEERRRKGKVRPPATGRAERMVHVRPSLASWEASR
ncbi:MAG: DUF927 domain-containing protein [Pseudomonadota bacterium]